MSDFNRSRLNITFLNISDIDGLISVYNKPMPCMGKKVGNHRLVYPLFTKDDWLQILLNKDKSNEISIPSNWRNNNGIKIPEDTFVDRFVALSGDILDSTVMCGLKPSPSNAIEVDIPACIEINGRLFNLDLGDFLMSNKLGTKFVVSKDGFEKLFDEDLDKACEFDFKVKSRLSSSNDYSESYGPSR